MQLSRLPAELYAEILSMLSDSEPIESRRRLADLNNCALVSVNWLEIVRPLLYSNVVVGDLDDRLRQFSRTIAGSLHLGALVENLEIHAGGCGRLYPDHQARLEETNSHNWMDVHKANEQFPRNAIARLSNLDALAIHCNMTDGPSPEGVLSLIANFANLTETVEVLELHGFSFDSVEDLAERIRGFDSLSSLHIESCQWIDFLSPGPGQSRPSSCRGLQTLELSANLGNGALLRVCPPTVKTLSLGPRGRWHKEENLGSEELFDALARYVCLQHLQLKTRMVNDEEYWVLDALSYAASFPRLRTLSLQIDAMDETLGDILYHAELLHSLDRIMTTGAFPSLRELQIEFVLWYSGEDYMDAEEYLEEFVQRSITRCPDYRGITVTTAVSYA